MRNLVGIRAVWVSAILALVTLFAPAAPANAYSVNLYFGPSPYGGYGQLYGPAPGGLSFTSAKRFTFNIQIWDFCPADGLGVSFYFNMMFASGNEGVTAPRGWWQGGCADGTTEPGEVNRDKIITKARVIACWTNGTDLCWSTPVDGIGNWKTNNQI